MDIKNETRKLIDDGLLAGEQAHELLHPYFGHISSCIAAGLDAWNEFQEKSPEKCVPLTSCTIAGIIHNHMAEHAKLVFSNMEPDVIVVGDTGFLIVDFCGRVKMRFKKLSKRLHPYNVATLQQQACDAQTLFGPSASLVTAGYRLTPFGTYKDAHIVCWTGSELRWSLRLPDTAKTAEVIRPATDGDLGKPVLIPKRSISVNSRQAT